MRRVTINGGFCCIVVDTILHKKKHCPYPDELVRRLVLLYSHEGDEILDPFLGSGQTARVALKYNRKVVGYDIEERYLALSESRLYDTSHRPFNLVPIFDKIPLQQTL